MLHHTRRLISSLRHRGLRETISAVFSYAFGRMLFRRVVQQGAPEERFTFIYSENVWGACESQSGPGSTLAYTANLRRALPALFDKYSIASVFDAPCGDFNWMRPVVGETHIQYTGGDIVAPLIEALNTKYESERVAFIHLDLITTVFPRADLVICRDCLFHFSFADTRRVLQNYLDSGSPYLLTTTHRNNGTFANRDITTGDFRRIDLFASPYRFPADPLERIDDWVPPHPEREMCLWSRDQVAQAVASGAR